MPQIINADTACSQIDYRREQFVMAELEIARFVDSGISVAARRVLRAATGRLGSTLHLLRRKTGQNCWLQEYEDYV
jgi:hypothetical protein